MKDVILKLILISLPLVAAFNVYGEDNGNEAEEPLEDQLWDFSGELSQVFNQVSFSNWAAGGENSFSSATITSLEANYEKGILSWENNLDMRYGLYQTESTPLRKNEDRIDLTSKFGREVTEHLNSSAMLNYKSQFTAGYDYPNDSVMVSKFMAPAFLTISAGMDYKPSEWLSVFASPVTGRFTFVLEEELADKGSFGVDSTENVKAEFGGMMVITFNRKILDNIRLRSKLEIFKNYNGWNEDDWYNSVVNWETSANVKITEYITVNLLLHAIYDQDVEEEWQIKQTFGLGFSYTF